MHVYVQGLSALAHYRSSSAKMDVEQCAAEIRSLEGATSSLKACTDAGIWRLGIGEPTIEHPLEVLVRDPKQRSRSRVVTARVWKHPLARTAFRKVSRDVYVSSPEFVFLQMATRLDLPELVALGMELCGTYRRNVAVPKLGTDETGYITVYHQPALSSPKRLRGFLSSMKSAPGCPKALRALDYVLPDSASPMETTLYLLLCLPRRLGGYALPKPVLNPPIVLTKAGKTHTIRSSAKPDLYWKDFRLDLEYNSDEFHDENQRALDSMRRKALERMHVEVIELTRDELFTTRLFHATVLRIARRIGKQLRPETEGSFSTNRETLRSCLLQDEGNDIASYEDGPTGFEQDMPAEEYFDDLWADELPTDLDETWSVEFQEADEDGGYVFGRGAREQNPE